MRQLNVVICGFDHYDGVEVNPSAEVPRALAEQGIGEPSDSSDVLGDVSLSITTVALPVSFANAWPTLERTIEAVRPNIVIATGLKHAARGIAMERCATNLMDAARPDVDNALPRSTPIISDGPAAYWTRLPLRAIINDFAHDGIPATLSSDAGTFVCNSLFYHLLNWASGQSRVLAGFVSFPLVCKGDGDVQRQGLALDQQIHAGRDVVRETVRYYLQPSSGDILLA